jgi:Cu/Ag efflux protein CusF
MLKKFTYTLTALLVMFGMLGVTIPAFALGNTRALKGTIVAVDRKARTMTVAPLHGTPSKIGVANSTVITRKGKSGKFSKLRVGDKVNLKFNTQTKQATSIVDSPDLYEIHGTVESVDTTASTVTIASEDGGNSVTVTVDPNTVIQRNGVAATLADLLVGDKVEAKYDSATMLASLIKTDVEDSELNGTIAALDTAASTVTITPDDGSADVVLNVVASTVIERNGVVATLADLLVGDKVEAKYDSATMLASFIKTEVEDGELKVKGTIAALDATANTVTIAPDDGSADVVLNVVASTVIVNHDTVIALSDLQAGDKVKAEYDSATLVASKIEVNESSSNH